MDLGNQIRLARENSGQVNHWPIGGESEDHPYKSQCRCGRWFYIFANHMKDQYYVLNQNVTVTYEQLVQLRDKIADTPFKDGTE